jgi:hypothetical protein
MQSLRNTILLNLIGLLLIAQTAHGQSFFDGKGRFRFGDNESTRINTAVTFGVGGNYYVGDLTDNSFGDGIRISPNISVGLQQKIGDRFTLRGEVMWYEIAGADSLSNSEGKQARNLSFRARNIEASLFGVVYFLNRGSTKSGRSVLSPYGLFGIGVSTNNPRALLDGTWYDLRPLRTEANDYGGLVAVLPLGFGIRMKVNNALDISLEGTYRITFSDYLDDVSTYYKAHNEGTLVYRLSDRGPEIGKEPVITDGPEPVKRGDYENNDGYFVASIKLQYYLPGNLFKKDGLVQNSKIKKPTQR